MSDRAAILALTAAALAGIAGVHNADAQGVMAIAGPIVISDRPSDQPIVLALPRDHGRSEVLNADPTPGGVQQIVGGQEASDWVPGSPLPYGAHPNQGTALIFVRTREPLPPIAISPWETITEEHIDELLRTRPWIRRGDSILEDLRNAQSQWLREHGYTGQPRMIVGHGDRDVPTVTIGVGSGVRVLGPDAPGAAEAAKAAAVEPTPEKLGMKPSAVIRVRSRH